LGKLAGVAQASSEAAPGDPAAQRRLRRALALLNVRYSTVDRSGRISGDAPLVRAVLTDQDVAALLAGHSVSAVRHGLGNTVYLEARATTSGGVVVAQRRTDATTVGNLAIRRLVVALLIAAAIAAAVAVLFATWLARPLRRTAEAAHALAAGRRDVTIAADGPAEVAEVADAVNGLSAALSVSEARQRDFLMSVSHDLRTPLTAIRGYAESLAEGVVAPDQSASVGAVLLDEARRLDRLVSDLLDLARLDAQDFRMEFADVDLAALVHDAGRVWSARCAGAGVPFAVHAPAGPIAVRTDAARLRQVLDGLLENALRVTPEGAPIVLAAGAGPAGAMVEVRDGGPGLTDSDLAVAFERSELYRRYQGVRKVGTGLGLAIVHRLVTRLGGRITGGHAPEGGARFTVHLPSGMGR
jgi:two-component system OmpR family sensor kinase